MEDKNINEKSQKIINKIKYIKNLSPSNKDNLLRKKISEEKNDKNNNNIDFNNNIKKVSLSPFSYTHIQKPASTEKELFRERIRRKSKEKEIEKNSINKSKNLTPLIHKYKKKNFYDGRNNSGLAKNMDESIEKKNKLYENQREPSFLNKYMAKIRENEMGEGKNYDNKNEERKMNGNYSYRGNSKNKENIMDLIDIMYKQYQQNKKKPENEIGNENLNNNNNKDIDQEGGNEVMRNNVMNDFEEKNIQNNDDEQKCAGDLNDENDNNLKNINNNECLNEENNEIENVIFEKEDDITFSKKAKENNNDIKNQKKTHEKIKSSNDIGNNNYQKIQFKNNNKLDDLNFFFNEIPKQNSKEKIFKKTPKNKKKNKRNMNKSVEIRNKNIIIPNINTVKISNSSIDNNYQINNEKNNKNDSKQPKNLEYNNNSDINKEVTNKNNRIPKLILNSKTIKQNSMTERNQNNNNNNDNNLICILCNKKCKKPLKCPKCFKIYCEQCIKNKKKKNKFCSSCNYYLNDITKYIEVKNINNKRNIKNKINKEIKDTTDDSLIHISGAGGEHNMLQTKTNIYSHSKTKSLIEQTPRFTQKNKSEKKSQKTKNKIKINGDKNINSHKKENLEGEENSKKPKKINDNNKKINERNKNKKLNDYSRNKIYNTTGEKIKKEKIKQNESIDLNEFDINKNKDIKINENEKTANLIGIESNPNDNNENINNKEEIIKEDNNNEFNSNGQDTNKINYEINNYEEDNNKELNKEEENNEDNNINKNEEEKDGNICPEHNNELKYYCFQCGGEICEECLNNHNNDHNLIDYSNDDNAKLKELILQKKENDNKNNLLHNYLNDFEQKIKMYKLEEELFISEINKIANNYIMDIESKISEIKILIEKIKNEQNIINENNKILNEYFNYFYNKNNENNINNIGYEDFISNNKITEISPVNYSPEILKLNNNRNIFKFNYFTSQTIHDIKINSNSNTILFSKIFFDENSLNNFIHDLKNCNNIIVINNEYFSDNNNLTDLKNIIFDESNIKIDSFSIKNYNGTALIQVNIDLNKNNENLNENIFYNNIKCYLLISNNEINNYCELDKKMISNGNLCLYNLILWEQFNIFIYNNLCFKILLFNYYK